MRAFGNAPTMVVTGSPFRNRIIVGSDMTWYDLVVSGFSSALTLRTASFPARSAASWASTGPTIRQGPHQVAQNSTSTGTSLPRTSAANVASVTSTTSDATADMTDS